MMVRPKKIIEQSKRFIVHLPLSQHQTLKDKAKLMSRNLDRQVSVADIIRISLELNLEKVCQFIEGQGPILFDELKEKRYQNIGQVFYFLWPDKAKGNDQSKQ